MVHNGIEYADMQLITEAYSIMKNVLGLTPDELHKVFKEWNEGELNSYLIEITADIFAKKDSETGIPLVDLILDVAGQKGTGKWTGQISLDLEVPAPTITTAVYERYISSMKSERLIAAKEFQVQKTDSKLKRNEFIDTIRKALYASKICAYAQGFSLMRKASEDNSWNLNYGNIAKIFRGGCIIRAQFLNQISNAYEATPNLPNLLLAPYSKILY
jgi:6-phosphogluconate dehydrogenase